MICELMKPDPIISLSAYLLNVKSFIRSMTLGILLEFYLKIYGGNIGMYPTALPLVNNYKNKNYRIYTFKLEYLNFFKTKKIFKEKGNS